MTRHFPLSAVKIATLTLLAGLATAPFTVHAAQPPVTKAAASAPWVAASNLNTLLVLEAQGKYLPENISSAGLTQYDGLSIDLGPDIDQRYSADLQAVQATLRQRLGAEKNEQIRQDLDILIGAIDDELTGIRLDAQYELRWTDVPELMFSGMQDLFQDGLPPARRAMALPRLQRYVGLVKGVEPLTEQAKARFTEKLGQPGLRGPVKARVEQSLGKVPTYIKGIRELFAKAGIKGAEPALAAMEKQLTAYAEWQRKQVLPVARSDFRMAPEQYAFQLKRVGIDIDPMLLIQNAKVEYMETRAVMQLLAPGVARQMKLDVDGKDYGAVIRALKKNTIPNDKLEAHYRQVNTELENAVRQAGIVDIPQRAMTMRLASAAESAASPAPHMRPPPMVGNQGEHGQFVLTGGNPAGGGKADDYDDFNFPGASWTVSAHEGRPGHELQFSAMIERGVSQARSMFAFNSVNVEGWALYAEAEMVPHEPADGQLIAMQLRLLRAARAMLDPMLNLGMTTREEAGRVLTDQVMVSKAMAEQELDRYTLRAPGQAGSYLYGYRRLLELRAETELALGAKFNALAFNNFLLGQGLLPPSLLAKAVREDFVPSQK